jgi:thiamine-phosphate pyrophosphorylase
LSAEAKPILCYVTDRRGLLRADQETPASPEELPARLVETIRRAVRAGVDWVQLREKDLEGRALGELARQAVGEAGGGARVIVNDRLDVAIAAGAGGVHLGQQSLPVEAVRRWCRAGAVPAGFLVGASCHSLPEAQAAECDGADYIFFGPVFPTPAKLAFGPPQGLERLEEVCGKVRIPVLAIGGVTAENAGACFTRGARGIAAIRLFQDAEDLAAVVERLRPS